MKCTNGYEHIRLTYVTHFYLNGDNHNVLKDLLSVYDSYNKGITGKVHFVIVDDGSPMSHNIDFRKFDLNIDLIRVGRDIPWNQGGARNVGVVNAKSDKIVIADIDQIFPEHTMGRLVGFKNPTSTFYKFYRKSEDGKWRKGHPNTFFMSRARFLRFYGYDEEFSGGYGAEDYRFVKNQKYHGSRQKYFKRKYYAMSRVDIDRENGYHSLVRDYERNSPIDARKAGEIREYGGEYGHSRLFMNFQWHKDEVSRMAVPPRDRMKPWWWRVWWLRTLLGSWY